MRRVVAGDPLHRGVEVGQQTGVGQPGREVDAVPGRGVEGPPVAAWPHRRLADPGSPPPVGLDETGPGQLRPRGADGRRGDLEVTSDPPDRRQELAGPDETTVDPGRQGQGDAFGGSVVDGGDQLVPHVCNIAK